MIPIVKVSTYGGKKVHIAYEGDHRTSCGKFIRTALGAWVTATNVHVQTIAPVTCKTCLKIHK